MVKNIFPFNFFFNDIIYAVDGEEVRVFFQVEQIEESALIAENERIKGDWINNHPMVIEGLYDPMAVPPKPQVYDPMEAELPPKPKLVYIPQQSFEQPSWYRIPVIGKL